MKLTRLAWSGGTGAAVLVVTAAAWIIWNDALRGPRELVLTIPPGAGTTAGDTAHGIPSEIRVRVGDVLVLKNEDTVTHRVGGLSVSPGSTASQGFRQTGTVQSTCTARSDGDVTYVIVPRPSFKELLGIELAVAGLLLDAGALAFAPWPLRRKLLLASTGAALAAAGLFVYVSATPAGPARQGPVANPIPADEASLAAGKSVYLRFCESCHGPTGLGDGPVAPSIAASTADLTVHIPIHQDDYLLATINTGIPAVNMPALEKTLSEEEKWHLINYLRALTDKPS